MCLCHQAVQYGTSQMAVTLCGWEGNRRSGVALAMRHRLSGLSTYGLNGLDREMSSTPTLRWKHVTNIRDQFH